MLGSLEDVGNIGESVWLTRRKVPGNPTIEDFTDADQPGLMSCTSCGPGCRVLDAGFRSALTRDPRLWYLKIAERLGAHVLVSSDKNRDKLVANDPLLRFDAIVLFKSPEQHWWSNLKKVQQQDPDFHPIQTLDTFMERWSEDYGLLLDVLRPQGRTLVLSFDDFCQAPEAHLKVLCARLGLPFDPRVLRNVRRDQHFFGGNALVGRTYRSATAPLALKPLPPAPLPEADRTRLREHPRLQAVWQDLMARYRHDFQAVTDTLLVVGG